MLVVGIVDPQAFQEAGNTAADQSPLEGEGDLGCNSTDILGASPNLSLFKFGVVRHVLTWSVLILK